MIISLIGFMAAGKTTMGRELSAKLGAPLIDTDAYIEEREGRTISEIFASDGESGFRRIEEECLEGILEEHVSQHPETLEDMTHCTLVLSLGGGIVTTPGCRDLISRFTYCVYVKADVDTLFERLSKDTGGRTLLENRGDASLRQVIEHLYHEREPLYEALARTTV
ncbi:MAG TPA: shikimate kinase [Candidatus Coprenecus stercoravium]|uniref:Shikimate kinase n=1 Tax=Candidatus Coprenecus stercoravium TaxID=2840735 RepID=A0A9D2K9N5_9BACT|nr:shikimate kinase [Candidatus Coprenecus stercoravium]